MHRCRADGPGEDGLHTSDLPDYWIESGSWYCLVNATSHGHSFCMSWQIMCSICNGRGAVVRTEASGRSRKAGNLGKCETNLGAC
ncbi:hypothetical protein Zmor_024648 [Zophobas morio]|uniref:Uncharacterized protein n=1 Tax=Zophobas morio TaxID=2755281 RepID=A0AA38I2W7_9CUCU|nr:hypothetical protein Zmor_024648 [Zophobas morio]